MGKSFFFNWQIGMDDRRDFKRRRIEVLESFEKDDAPESFLVEKPLEKISVDELVDRITDGDEGNYGMDGEESDSTSSTVILSWEECSSCEKEDDGTVESVKRECLGPMILTKAIGSDLIKTRMVAAGDIIFQLTREPDSRKEEERVEEIEVIPIGKEDTSHDNEEEEKDSPVKKLIDSAYYRYDWLFSETGDYISSFLGKVK